MIILVSTVLCPLFSLSFAIVATIYASRLLQLHLIPFTLPICLNSLDCEGARLLSPRDSQILPKQLQVSTIPVQVMQPSSDGSSMKILVVTMFRFMLISSGAQSGSIGDLAVGLSSFLLASSVVGLCVYSE